MASEDYDFDVSAVCPDGKVNPSKLQASIEESAIVTAMDYALGPIETSGGSFEGGVQVGGWLKVWFKEQVSSGDETILNGLVANAPNTPSEGVSKVEISDSEGDPISLDKYRRLVTAVETPAGSSATKATHNFCDPCTWFQSSVRETEQSLTDSGDGLRWESLHENWIDMYHGRILDDTTWRDPDWCPQAPSHKYAVKVETSDDGGSTWAEKTMQDPNTTLDGSGSDGDYYVDYESGEVVFHSSQAGKRVRATYSRASTDDYASVWRLYPNPGYKLSVIFAEMQFSSDVVMNDTLFQRIMVDHPTYGWIDASAPAYYMRLAQAIAEASTNSAYIPAVDETSKRGVQQYQQFQFKYVRRESIDATTGVQIWIGLSRDIALGGTELSITFHFEVDEE